MGKYALKSDVRGKEFSEKYLPKDLKWSDNEDGKDPYNNNVAFAAGTYLIYNSFFKQVRLKIPFDPLLVDFFRKTKLPIILKHD